MNTKQGVYIKAVEFSGSEDGARFMDQRAVTL